MSSSWSSGRRQRVLQVYRTYFPEPQGGLQETIRQICHSTQTFGVEHRVFTLSPHPTPHVLSRAEAEVHRFPLHFEIASSGFSFGALKGFRALVEWCDVVHYHFPWPFGDLLHLLARARKPALVTYHSDIVRQRLLGILYQPLRDRFLNRMQRIVATSPHYAASSPVLRQFRTKVEVIPLALDEHTYPVVTQEELETVRAWVGEGFFLFVGVLRYYKGLQFLLEAVKNTTLSVVIAGEGPERANLEQRARRLGLGHVRFLGQVSDAEKVALMQLCRAVVFPSHLRSEAFGVTLLEGAMYAKPLVSCEIATGTSYVNQAGETGLVVPPADPTALRAAMLRLTTDPDLAARLGRGARERFERLFRGDQMGASYARLYAELAASDLSSGA